MGTAYDYDLLVIGAGSGGTRTARWSASLGAKVAICEEYRYGGTCVVRGCIPKKLLAYASELNAELTTAQSYGQRLERGAFDWAQCKVHRDREVAHLSALYRDMLLKQEVVLKPGKGRVTGPHTVEVCGELLSAERILVATGCEPSLTSFPGHQWAITSNQIFSWEYLPRSLLVVGGGFIAVEMASILSGLGVEVEMVIRGKNILRGFDQELAIFLAQELAKKGVVLSPQCQVKALKKRPDNLLEAQLSDGTTRQVEQALLATGRVPKTSEIGLLQAGVKLGARGEVLVDQHFCSSVPSIYAVGDCIDRVQLTPVALAQGTALAEHWFNGRPIALNHDTIACAVFSSPPLATVGLSEEQALADDRSVDVYRSQFCPLKYTLSGRKEKALMKMVVERASDQVLGLHMVGKDAPEIIQLGAVAIAAGAKKQHFDQTLGIHPTSAEEFVTM